MDIWDDIIDSRFAFIDDLNGQNLEVRDLCNTLF
jgi:hypothetical protein